MPCVIIVPEGSQQAVLMVTKVASANPFKDAEAVPKFHEHPTAIAP